MSVIQISAQNLQKKIQNQKQGNLLLLDVREQHEFEFTHIEGSQHIPLHQIPERLSEINSSQECVAICHHGIRSQHAAAFLLSVGFTQIYNLSGGIDAWSVDCDNTVLRY